MNPFTNEFNTPSQLPPSSPPAALISNVLPVSPSGLVFRSFRVTASPAVAAANETTPPHLYDAESGWLSPPPLVALSCDSAYENWQRSPPATVDGQRSGADVLGHRSPLWVATHDEGARPMSCSAPAVAVSRGERGPTLSSSHLDCPARSSPSQQDDGGAQLGTSSSVPAVAKSEGEGLSGGSSKSSTVVSPRRVKCGAPLICPSPSATPVHWFYNVQQPPVGGERHLAPAVRLMQGGPPMGSSFPPASRGSGPTVSCAPGLLQVAPALASSSPAAPLLISVPPQRYHTPFPTPARMYTSPTAFSSSSSSSSGSVFPFRDIAFLSSHSPAEAPSHQPAPPQHHSASMGHCHLERAGRAGTQVPQQAATPNAGTSRAEAGVGTDGRSMCTRSNPTALHVMCPSLPSTVAYVVPPDLRVWTVLPTMCARTTPSGRGGRDGGVRKARSLDRHDGRTHASRAGATRPPTQWKPRLEAEQEIANIPQVGVDFTSMRRSTSLPTRLRNTTVMPASALVSSPATSSTIGASCGTMRGVGATVRDSARSSISAIDLLCPICQEEGAEGDRMATLRCSHTFHTHCLQSWLMRRSVCPLCRKGVLDALAE